MIGQTSGGQNSGEVHDGAVKALLTGVLCLLFWKLQSQGVRARTDRMLLHSKAGGSGPSPTWTRWIFTLRSADLKVDLIGLRVERVENSQSWLGVSSNNVVSSACWRHECKSAWCDYATIIRVLKCWCVEPPVRHRQIPPLDHSAFKIKWCNRIYEVKNRPQRLAGQWSGREGSGFHSDSALFYMFSACRRGVIEHAKLAWAGRWTGDLSRV